MSKFYKISLISIALFLVLSLMISFSYGVWLSNQNTEQTMSFASNCLRVIINNDTISLNKPLSISDDDGYGSSAYPFTVENICNSEEDVELRIDTLEGSTIENNKLKIYVNGDIEVKPTILEELVPSKSYNEGSITSNLVLSFKVGPNKTIRGNVRMWLSKDAVLTSNKEDYLGKIYFTTEETIIKPIFKEVLLAKEGIDNINSKEEVSFDNTESLDTGLHILNDDEGVSYYYRGNVQNNYVSFADKLWRIVRINGNGSIRMILDDSIDNNAYNNEFNLEKYSGYIYHNEEEEVNSNVKNIIDKWYQENIKDKGLDKYVVTENFCNDTSVSSTEGTRINYLEYENLFLRYTPTLKCGSTEKDYGGSYRLKVGLITASETYLAGASLNKLNDSYYLYKGSSFVTMSPIDFYNGKSYVGIILDNGAFNNAPVNEVRGIRPVINLSTGTTVSGNGTIDNPYIIDIQE